MPKRKTTSSATTKTILGTGLVCLDVVHLPDGSTQTFAGGTCGNVLAILAYLGWHAVPVARLAADSGGEIVEKDLQRWGVDLDLLRSEPVASTPVIVETIRTTTTGQSVHKFSLRCPACRGWFPTYRPVTAVASEPALQRICSADVFFFDRASRGALTMAAAAKDSGAIVVFEPASIGNPSLFNESIQVADIVKYSQARLDQIGDVGSSDNPLLEVMTLGEDGIRFRKRNRSKKMGKWRHLEALEGAKIRDSAGAGDWTTALLIDRITQRKPASVSDVSIADLIEDLTAAQAAGSWSCRFEGARGGMYVTTPEKFRRAISDAAYDATSVPKRTERAGVASDFCPSCG